MLFYTILFSLGEPKQNLYVQMLHLQLASLRRTGTLAADDEFLVLTEKKTADYLAATSALPPNVKILLVRPPSTTLQGMLLKYILPRVYDCRGKTCLYLDLDILSCRKLELGPLEPDNLYVFPEGRPDDTNYCGSTPLELSAGVTAGIFLYTYGPKVQAFFDAVLGRIAASTETFYSLDQPHFNHALAAQKVVRGLPPTLISFNWNTHRDTARFVNLCGDPGDGPFHFQKMLQVFLRIFVA